MRIHTNSLLMLDLYKALSLTTQRTALEKCEYHGSRSRKWAWEVGLESDGTPDQFGTKRNRKRNPGQGNGAYYNMGKAASYDDWGWWLSALFEVDAQMIAGPYEGADDFHRQTGNKYEFQHVCNDVKPLVVDDCMASRVETWVNECLSRVPAKV